MTTKASELADYLAHIETKVEAFDRVVKRHLPDIMEDFKHGKGTLGELFVRHISCLVLNLDRTGADLRHQNDAVSKKDVEYKRWKKAADNWSEENSLLLRTISSLEEEKRQLKFQLETQTSDYQDVNHQLVVSRSQVQRLEKEIHKFQTSAATVGTESAYQKISAWHTVFDLLSELRPGWASLFTSGAQAASAAIRAMHKDQQEAEKALQQKDGVILALEIQKDSLKEDLTLNMNFHDKERNLWQKTVDDLNSKLASEKNNELTQHRDIGNLNNTIADLRNQVRQLEVERNVLRAGAIDAVGNLSYTITRTSAAESPQMDMKATEGIANSHGNYYQKP